MKKAIVLTYPNLNEEEKKLLQNTEVFKIACNWHAEHLKPHKRLICDRGIIDKVKAVGKQKIITFLEYYPDERLEDYRHLPARHSSLLSCVDYLIENKFTDVLLIADNTQTNQKEIDIKFQEHIRKTINQQSNFTNIYKYSSRGVFDIPHVTIKEFLKMKNQEYLPLTAEDKLLGLTAPKRKNMLEMFAFSDAYLYEVYTEGVDNKSVETGELLKNFLPPKLMAKIMEGETEIKYGNITIKRLTGVKKGK